MVNMSWCQELKLNQIQVRALKNKGLRVNCCAILLIPTPFLQTVKKILNVFCQYKANYSFTDSAAVVPSNVGSTGALETHCPIKALKYAEVRNY